MSEPPNVRLVRCPKCENLLTVLADYSVYQCGGCGAFLGGKNKNFEVDTLSQKSDEETVQVVSEKISGKSNNFRYSERGMNFSDGSENDFKSNDTSSRRADKREILGNIANNQRNGSPVKADKSVEGNYREATEKLDTGKEFEEMESLNGIENGLRRSGRISDWSGDGGENEGFSRNLRRDVQGVRYLTSNYSEDGPSNYHLRSDYSYGEPVNYQNKCDEFHGIEYLGEDGTELLRKLDELKDQLCRSCDVVDKPKEKFPLDRVLIHHEETHGGPEKWFPNSSWAPTRASVQYSMPDSYFVARPPYVSHYPRPSPYINGHEIDMHRFYPSMHTTNQIQRFWDPLRSQMLGRAPHQGPCPLQQQTTYPYFSRQYSNNDMGPSEQFPPNMLPPNMNLHQPSCSCFHCYTKHPQVSAPVLPAAFHNKLFLDAFCNKPMLYHHGNPGPFGPLDFNPEVDYPPVNSHRLQSQTRWPSDLNSEVCGFARRHPVILATGKQYCQPIAGGAPFLTCYNCFELLQLPKNILLMEEKPKKVRCGACSIVSIFTVVNKRLIVSVDAETERTPKMVDDSSTMTLSGGALHSRVHLNQDSINFSSDDYDNSGYDFHSMDRQVISPSTRQGYCSSKSADMRSLPSTSSEVEDSPESLNAQGEESNPAQLAGKANLSPPPPGSTLQDHFDYSNKYRAVNQFGKGNQSGRLEREKRESKKATMQQNSMKDASLANEMEVSFNEYSNTGTSQESGDAIREGNQLRVTKGGQTFFAGIIKKSFKDFSKSNQTFERSTTNVTINGHPIPDRLLKKAEKLSGLIHPGQYWYDSRAGFWGVMGGPCLGIIPPFIEEFNFPMPENCAGGNTGVFVNGREIHEKDLLLLGSRGLPTTRDRYYIIEISGRVLDEDTGDELASVGKLAPTVEKVRRGFGMKVPRVAV